MTMNPEEFESLLRQFDPGEKPDGSDGKDLILQQSRQQWSRLATRRAVVRRRLSLCVAASAIFAMVGGATIWIGRDHRTSRVAESTVEHPIETPHDERIAESPLPGEDHGAVATLLPEANDRVKSETGRELESLIAFSEFVEAAGKTGSQSWLDQCGRLARQNPQTQRLAVELVGQLEAEPLRRRAFDLVCQSAGVSEKQVLMHWLSQPNLRMQAWERLVGGATFVELQQMIGQTQTDLERLQLCERIAASPDPNSVGVLLTLAQQSQWRPMVHASADRLDDAKIRQLIMLMRQRNSQIRTAAAFVLASVRDETVDQTVASMVLGRRYQQPAYLVLLSRNTPEARAFLAKAASNPQLNPALFSAQAHFATIQRQLQQWIAESKGTNDEKTDTTGRLSPHHSDDHRIAGRGHSAMQLG